MLTIDTTNMGLLLI